MFFMRRIIDRASENVQQTPVDRATDQAAKSMVKRFRIFSTKIGDAANAQFPQIVGYALAHTGDRAELF
jgi:hypothetical protein